MGDLPSMPLFVDDYEAATAHLSLEEDGAYNRLLRLCWRHSACSVPDDDEWIRRHMRVDSEKYELVIRPIIDEFFTRSGGRVFQKRQQRIREFARNKTAARKEAGRKGGQAKARKTKEKLSSNAKDLPEQKAGKALASKTKSKTKESKGLGLDRRSLSPGGPDPPSDKPDPRKFLMTKDWTMSTDVQERLTAEHVPKLGADGFWRQVGRFMDYHADLGTVDSQSGFERSLENWLDRANDNLDQELEAEGNPRASGSCAGVNGHDPPSKPALFLGIEIEVFTNRVTELYDAQLKENALKPLSKGERRTLLAGASAMKIGRSDSVGIDRGGLWTLEDVAERLGLAPELDQVAS